MQRWIELAPGLRVTGHGIAWLPAERTIVAADVHLGYELAAQRRGGYLPPVARGSAVGARLADIARELAATRVVIAGDLRHSTRDVDAAEREELAQLARAVGQVATLEVVLGNHDRGGSIVGSDTAGVLRIGGVDIVHAPPRLTPHVLTICGHLHPRITVRDAAGAASRFACVLAGERIIVLPAFSEWAGGAEASRLLAHLPGGRWRALPIVAGEIADLGIVLGSAVAG